MEPLEKCRLLKNEDYRSVKPYMYQKTPEHIISSCTAYNSVEGYRSNPVLAVKCLLFVENKFLRSIFLRPPARCLNWAFNATLDTLVACQMAKLEQIKS